VRVGGEGAWCWPAAGGVGQLYRWRSVSGAMGASMRGRGTCSAGASSGIFAIEVHGFAERECRRGNSAAAWSMGLKAGTALGLGLGFCDPRAP